MRLEDILMRASVGTARVLERERGTRESAVAVVLRDNVGDVEVLLIKRAEHEADPWSGHMAFPGGRRDSGDADLLATALRETREELGVDLRRDARFVRPLDEVEAVARGVRTGLAVRPHLFVLEREVTPVPNHEVAAVVWASLAGLRSEEAQTTLQYDRGGVSRVLPGVKVGPHVVWGLTHYMLTGFFARIDDALP